MWGKCLEAILYVLREQLSLRFRLTHNSHYGFHSHSNRREPNYNSDRIGDVRVSIAVLLHQQGHKSLTKNGCDKPHDKAENRIIFDQQVKDQVADG